MYLMVAHLSGLGKGLVHNHTSKQYTEEFLISVVGVIWEAG